MKINLKLLSYFVLLFFSFHHSCFGEENIWEVIRLQFSLNHELDNVAVQEQIQWLKQHPHYVSQLSQSAPYIYHIIHEIKKHHLPGEIALIPMIESSYDPFAYSIAGAAGLWQLMPETGTELGLKQDWWFDGRRSILNSTTAALNYLNYLQESFHHDWLLAFAAYDAGIGTVNRALEKNLRKGPNPFWSLKLPKETQVYVPRLLALADLIAHPERYHLKLPDIPHAPYFTEVNMNGRIDLNAAAKLAGISFRDLRALNPGFKHFSTRPYFPYKLLIPFAKAERFTRNLAESAPLHDLIWKNQSGEILHSPQPGFNRKTPPPKPQFKALNTYKLIHIVQKNESVDDLKRKYQISEEALLSCNHLSKNRRIYEGQPLTICKSGETAPNKASA